MPSRSAAQQRGCVSIPPQPRRRETRCSRGFIQSPRRAGEQCRRHVEPEHLRGLEINHEFKCGRLHDGRRAPSELIELLSIRCDSERSCFDLKAFFIYFPSTSTNQSRNLHLSSLLGAWTSDAIDLSVLDQLRHGYVCRLDHSAGKPGAAAMPCLFSLKFEIPIS